MQGREVKDDQGRFMNFNYNTLEVNLRSETRSIEILLNRPEQNHAINVEMLFELESLLSWLTSHLEVNAIVLSSTDSDKNLFSSGFDQNELSIMSDEKVQKYMVRFQKIVASLLHLPQTVICDLKNGANGMAVELSLGADIRLASHTSSISFDNLDRGWTSCAGGIGLLSHLIGHSFARQWTLSSHTIGQDDMIRSGLVLSTYSAGENATLPILEKIIKQAPIARIQTKGALLEEARPDLEASQQYETAFSFAALSIGDWKKGKEDFTSARDFSTSDKKPVYTPPQTPPDLQA